MNDLEEEQFRAHTEETLNNFCVIFCCIYSALFLRFPWSPVSPKYLQVIQSTYSYNNKTIVIIFSDN